MARTLLGFLYLTAAPRNHQSCHYLQGTKHLDDMSVYLPSLTPVDVILNGSLAIDSPKGYPSA